MTSLNLGTYQIATTSSSTPLIGQQVTQPKSSKMPGRPGNTVGMTSALADKILIESIKASLRGDFLSHSKLYYRSFPDSHVKACNFIQYTVFDPQFNTDPAGTVARIRREFLGSEEDADYGRWVRLWESEKIPHWGYEYAASYFMLQIIKSGNVPSIRPIEKFSISPPISALTSAISEKIGSIWAQVKKAKLFGEFEDIEVAAKNPSLCYPTLVSGWILRILENSEFHKDPQQHLANLCDLVNRLQKCGDISQAQLQQCTKAIEVVKKALDPKAQFQLTTTSTQLTTAKK